jgi:NADPH2:quinone reductase
VAGKNRVEAARALGLKHVVVAGADQLSEASGGGADVLYDLVGRATFDQGVAALRDGGTVDLIGSASGEPDVDAAALTNRQIRIARSSNGDHLLDRVTLLAAR